MAKTIGTESRRKTAYGRFYELPPPDAVEVPSITNILGVINKPALVGWSAKVERQACIEAAVSMLGEAVVSPDRFRSELEARIGKVKASQKLLTEAGAIGTAAHALCEWRIRKLLLLPVGLEPEAPEAAQWCAMSFEDWMSKHKFKPVHSEMVVYSRKHKFAGTLDFTGYVDGVFSVGDVKTGKAVYPEAYLQLSAYREAMREMGMEVPEKAYVLRLPKNVEDPEFEAVEVPDLDRQFEGFLAARALWQWHHNQSINND